MGQGRRVEPVVGGQLVDQAAAEPLEAGVGQAERAAEAAVAERREPVARRRGPGATPCSSSSAATSAAGSGSNRTTWHRETIVSSCDLGRRADQDQDGTRRRLLQRLQERVGRLLVEVVGVVEDRHLPQAPGRLEAELVAEVADHDDRQLVLVLGPCGLDEVGMGVGLDLEAAGARLARVEPPRRAGSRRAGACASLRAKVRLPIPSGPTNSSACGNRPCSRLRRSSSTTRS